MGRHVEKSGQKSNVTAQKIYITRVITGDILLYLPPVAVQFLEKQGTSILHFDSTDQNKNDYMLCGDPRRVSVHCALRPLQMTLLTAAKLRNCIHRQ